MFNAPRGFRLPTAIRERVQARLESWAAQKFGERFWNRDYRLWAESDLPELSDRLGWLDLPTASQALVSELRSFAGEIVEEGWPHAVVLGMGGSSLAPDVFRKTWPRSDGHPTLLVLDSTHPQAVYDVGRRIDPANTLFLVSSKSGSTVETLSLFRHFWARTGESTDEPGLRFAAVTDPGSPLETLARERGFRKILSAPEDVGGRYSALTAFGLAPAAVAGIDIGSLLESAAAMASLCGPESEAAENPGLQLGAALGEMALSGRDKVTFLTTPSLEGVPAWIEQLLAESTGKEGRGLIPIVGEPAGEPGSYGRDRAFVLLSLAGEDEARVARTCERLAAADHPVLHIAIPDLYALGGEFFRWEVATAAASAVLGIHPFNQPDVELAKRLAREAISDPGQRSKPVPSTPIGEPQELETAMREFLGSARPGDYIALQAWLARSPEAEFALQRMRGLLREAEGTATTLGFGPRFLHSTGQLHKGGPDSGLFLQLVEEGRSDIEIPEADYTFRGLMNAQALGDARALLERGRRFLRITLGEDAAHSLARLVHLLGG